MSMTLATLVHRNQTGFVPGRNIHDAIGTYFATRHTAKAQGTNAVVVWLDFKKAYDTLDECGGGLARFQEGI